MKGQQNMEAAFAPRWTWRTVLFSGGVTASLYLMLPSLELLSHPPEKMLEVRRIKTIELPTPPPPMDRPKPKPKRQKPTPPKPKLQQMKQRLSPLQAMMSLNVAMGNVGGDFAVAGFSVDRGELNRQVGDLVFELSDLDEKPRPLTRLKPAYPPQARMRKIEGIVVIDFVVAEDGSARSIEVVSEQPSSIFTQAAMNAIAHWRFSPGIKGGKPVAARVRQKVKFSLN